MEIEIPSSMLEEIKRISEEKGINEKELVAQMIKLYLENKDFVNLKEEIEVWEEMGTEDSNNFLKKHNL